MIRIIHTQGVNSVDYHKKLLKKLIYRLSQKIGYASKIIDPVINGFSPNAISSHLRICDKSIVTFGIREKCIKFSNISHVDSLYRFRISVVDKVNTDI